MTASSNPSAHFQHLHTKWSAHHTRTKESLFKKHRNVLHWLLEAVPHKHHITATALSALLVLIPPMPQFHHQNSVTNNASLTAQTQSAPNKLKQDLQSLLPSKVQPLTTEEETQIAYTISRDTNISVTAQLNGIHLPRTYGVIGGEQHLKRYPGDTIAQHATNDDERKMFLSSGMAPSLGSYHYFDESNTLTTKAIEREKYYIALPYHLTDGYNDHVKEYKDFFKFRKILVVNPNTGSAVVVVIGDAGPGQSTGKHLGGSPEVMHYLDLAKGSRKGAVLYFFINDPNDTIPLGPLKN